MKIAHLPGSFLPVIGGAELIVHNMANRQAALGHDVYVFANRAASDLFEEEGVKVNYNIIEIPLYIRGFNRIVEKFKRIDNTLLKHFIINKQKQFSFDIWHFNLLNCKNLKILETITKEKVPSIGTFQGGDIQFYPEYNYGMRKDLHYEKLLFNNINYFSHLTAISNTVKKEYLKLNVSENKITIIPNFIKIKDTDNNIVNKSELLEKYNIIAGKKIILTVGRNHPKKGYEQIPFIIKKLITETESFHWIIIGKECDSIINTAKQLNIESYVTSIGEIGSSNSSNGQLEFPSNELMSFYKFADIFCFPTYLETFGNVYLESMAAGTPIVTTNAPGACDVVFHGKNGLVSQFGNPEQMAQNILKLIKDKALCQKLINNGKKTVIKYNEKNIVQKYLKLYEDVINC